MLVLALLLAAWSARADGQTITGTVTDAGTGAPLANVQVDLYNSNSSYVGRWMTNTSGVYTTTGLETGAYYLRTLNSFGYIDELYNNLSCPGGSCSIMSGTAVNVTAGATTSGVDFGLAVGGHVSGTVTDAGTGAPIVSEGVYVLDANGNLIADGYTNASGVYTTSTGLPTGTYYVRTWIFYLGYLDEQYDNIPCPEWLCSVTTGTGVYVEARATTSGINFALVKSLPGGDFTGDLKSDILWRHASVGDVWLWPMNGPSRTSESYVGTVADTNWEIRGQGDLNGDGRADLVWRHKTAGVVYYWPMNGTTRLAETYVSTVDTAYDIIGTGDFDGDGKADLLWRNPTAGDLWIWLMNGATVRSAVYVDTVGPGYQIKGIGDLDGNGKADLVWHGVGGDVWVWPMNGTTPVSRTYVGTVPDVRYQIQQVADFDGNGMADLLWRHSAAGDLWVWLMNGPTRLSENYVGVVPDPNYRIVGAGDYDGNRKADILWHHATRGEVWVWLMNGPEVVSENHVGTVPDTGYQIVKAK